MKKVSLIILSFFSLLGLAGLAESGNNSDDITSHPTIQIEEELTETPTITFTPTPTAKPTKTPTPKQIYTPVPTAAPAAVVKFNTSSSSYSCDCSKTCPNMSSCKEAYYQLNSCGCGRRDGDNDGVPCENICPGG